MNINEIIRSQARMNAEEIQGIIAVLKNGICCISGLLVIREDTSKLIRIYADEIQHGDNQLEILAYEEHIKSIATELHAINETIVSVISGETNTDIDIDKIIKKLERLNRALLQLTDINK